MHFQIISRCKIFNMNIFACIHRRVIVSSNMVNKKDLTSMNMKIITLPKTRNINFNSNLTSHFENVSLWTKMLDIIH